MPPGPAIRCRSLIHGTSSSSYHRKAKPGCRELIEEILTEGLDRGLILDTAVAGILEQAKLFWRLREMFGEVQQHEGGSIKRDLCLPVSPQCRISLPRPMPRSQRFFPEPARCPSGILAMAISPTMSASRSAPIGRSFSRAGTKNEHRGFCGRKEV